MFERLFILIGSIFLIVACVEFLVGYALHSTVFSSFTGGHTFISKKNDPAKWKTAIIFHSLVGIAFILLDIFIV